MEITFQCRTKQDLIIAYSGSKIYFPLNVVQGFRTLPNLAVVRVCIFAGTRRNTEIFAQIETVG